MAFDISKLGVKKNIPKVNFLSYTGVFQAPEKFGKTTFASLYPNAILLATEVGYNAQVINYKDMKEWEDFVEFIDMLEENREEIGEDIQTIVIDTVNELYNLCAPYITKKYSRIDKKLYSNIRDIPYGNGFNYLDDEFRKQLNRILQMKFCVLYLTHSATKTIKPKNGEPYDVYKSTMTDRCEKIIYPSVDYILNGERRKVEVNGKHVLRRVLTVKGNEESVAGNRVYFDEDIVFETEEEAMDEFRIQFRNKIEETLRKNGITTDLDVLEEKQMQERSEEIKKFAAEKRESSDDLSASDIHEQLNVSIKELDSKQRAKVTSGLKEILGGTANYTKTDDIELLQKCIELVAEIAG